MKKGQSDEQTEASYLQLKLSPITEATLVGLGCFLINPLTVEGFIAQYNHDCAVGSSQAPVVKWEKNYQPPASPDKKGNALSLLFCCSSCQRDFISSYFYDLKEKTKPTCPECGTNIFVDEVK